MNAFQIVGLSLITLVFAGTLLRLIRGRQRVTSAAWLLVWAAAGVTIYEPNITRDVAQAVGIQRGADLVAYLTTLSLLAVIFFLGFKLRRFESHITQLTRELALTRAELPVRVQTQNQRRP